jgi:hypothetical protein
MQSAVGDTLIQIIQYCDLSICSLVCKLFNDISIDIQSRCRNTKCGLWHPKCILKRPYDVAIIATRYDHVGLLRWLKANVPTSMWQIIDWLCLTRWDLYKRVYKYITGKTTSRFAAPMTDEEFAFACHTGRRIIAPFNVSLRQLPLRGLAANHATRYNQYVKFVFSKLPIYRVFNINQSRVDISEWFHTHNLDAIKQVASTVSPVSLPLYISYLAAHIGLCDDLYNCNSVETCEWIIENSNLDPNCHYAYGILKFNIYSLKLNSKSPSTYGYEA